MTRPLALLRETAARPLALWIAFALVHAWLWFLNLTAPGFPLGDVDFAYLPWVEQGLIGGRWLGIDAGWVYPYVALAPMLAAYVGGPALYTEAWLALVTALNAGALLCLSGVGRRVRHVLPAWWWMLLLTLLGPIALGRIDSITAPLAVAAVALLARRPRIAAALLALGAWIKIWPGALLLAAAIAARHRAAVIGTAAAFSALVVALGLALGGTTALLTPITEQAGRGLQVESVVATVWLWAAAAGEWGARVYYDDPLLTFQVAGLGVDAAAAAMTPLLAVGVGVLVLLAVVAQQRGVDEQRLLPVLGIALVAALVVLNKVGSPQFATWLAAPIVLGLLAQRRGGPHMAVPACLALAIGALTQTLYPVLYGRLLALEPVMLVAITVRNLLWVALLAWGVAALVRLVRASPVPTAESSAGSWSESAVDRPARRGRLGAPLHEQGASS